MDKGGHDVIGSLGQRRKIPFRQLSFSGKGGSLIEQGTEGYKGVVCVAKKLGFDAFTKEKGKKNGHIYIVESEGRPTVAIRIESRRKKK